MTSVMASFITAFGLGFMGSGHCIGMCGGIVTSLSSTAVNPAADNMASRMVSQLLFNLGRIGSYMIVGALLATLAVQIAQPTGALAALRWLAAFMTIAIGLSITGWLQLLSPLEKMGSVLWQRIQPLTKWFIPARSSAQLLGLGMLWGWLPCGLVYSAASYALVSGNAVQGAIIMLAFGLGTLPAMLLAGFSAQSLTQKLKSQTMRQVFGSIVIVMGAYMGYIELNGHQGHEHHHQTESTLSQPQQSADEHHHHHSHH